MRGATCALLECCTPARKGLLSWWKLFRTGVHLIEGWLIVTAVFPFSNARARAALVQAWSRRLLALYAIRLEVDGEPPGSRAALVVANHVSWLDVVVLNAVTPLRFVAKAEVRCWPLIGRLARKAGTLFIHRERMRDAGRMKDLVSGALQRGERVAVFPEGTSTCGDRVLPFRASLLQSAVAAHATIHPVSIRYVADDGAHCEGVAYYGDRTFLSTLRATCGMKGLRVCLVFAEPIAPGGADRRALACTAHAAVRRSLGTTHI